MSVSIGVPSSNRTLGDSMSVSVGAPIKKPVAPLPPVPTSGTLFPASQEQKLIDSYRPVCPRSRTELSVMLRHPNLEEWHNLIREKFYDSGVLNAYECIIESLMLSSPPGTTRRLFLKPTPLGSGVNGVATTIDLQGTLGTGLENQVLVEKVSTQNEGLAHELAIGLFATNKLRRIDPGFAYYFRASKCGPLGLDSQKKQVLTWCAQNSFPTQLAILEGVPGKSMGKWLKDATVDQVIGAILSYMTTLLVGQQQCGFVHYDSHIQNIIMRPVGDISGKGFVRRLWNGVMINVDFVPTLIDFGMSRAVVNINGKNTVLSFQEQIGISTEYLAGFHQLEDIGRTLGWSMIATKGKRPDLYRVFKYLGDMLIPNLESLHGGASPGYFYQYEREPRMTMYQYWTKVTSLPVVYDWLHRNMIRGAPKKTNSDTMQVIIQLGFPLNGNVLAIDLADVATLLYQNPERKDDFNPEKIYVGAEQEIQKLNVELVFPVTFSNWNSLGRASDAVERAKELLEILAILVSSFPNISPLIDRLNDSLQKRLNDLAPIANTLRTQLPTVSPENQLRIKSLSFI
jgi:hypothetical protein